MFENNKQAIDLIQLKKSIKNNFIPHKQHDA